MGGPRIGSLCTGYGGLDMAAQAVFGGELAWVSDVDPGACQIIAHRHPGTPNIGDLTVAPWAALEPVDILVGGYPCQPFSTAGLRKGTSDERHIWPYIADALRVLRPRVAVFENVAGHLRLGFDTVLADLARIGFDAQWCLVRASEVGAPHQRNRLFILATPADAADLGHQRGGRAREWRSGPADHGVVAADAARIGRREGWTESAGQQGRPGSAGSGGAVAADADGFGGGAGQQEVREGQPDAAWGRFLPAVRRWEGVLGRCAPRATDDRNRLAPAFVEWMMGLPAGHVTDVPGLTRAQQLKALGNGVVPQQAEAAIRLLFARASESSATVNLPAAA